MANVNPDISNDLHTRFFILNQKFFKENNTVFFKEYEALIKKWEYIARVMKFISKLSTGTQTINLIEFYKTGNKKQPLWLSDKFKKILKEATIDSETVEIDETFYQYQNNEEGVAGSIIMIALNEAISDLGTIEGRLEMRKRLGVLAFYLKKQPKARNGDLITNCYTNVIGWCKTQSGSVLSAGADSGDRMWYCDTHDIDGNWPRGYRFWSRNGEA